MRTAITLVVCVLLLPVFGCSEEGFVSEEGRTAAPSFKQGDPQTDAIDIEAASAEQAGNFVARLSADQEVTATPVDSRARGVATFRLSADGNELSYRLIVAGLDKIVQSHIHLAAAGVNGPVVTFLYGPVAPGAETFSGVLAEGTITSANLVGPLAGQSLSALVEAMRDGGAYVNVHTGDYAGGEIRGQIR